MRPGQVEKLPNILKFKGMDMKKKKTAGTKLLRASHRAWVILLREAFRQSAKKDRRITMGDVIEQFASKLNKKHKHY